MKINPIITKIDNSLLTNGKQVKIKPKINRKDEIYLQNKEIASLLRWINFRVGHD